MTPNAIVSRAEWIEARKAHLAEERALTHARDALLAQRRALPWLRVEADYVFQSDAGPRRLADLFAGREQLLVYHFMLVPDEDAICRGCAFLSDHVDAARQHFEQAGLSFVAVSRVPLARIQAVKARMGWSFDWVSSEGTRFNFDHGVSFTPEQVAADVPLYNFGTTPYLASDLHGTSVFARGDDGAIFQTYASYARGNEVLAGAFAFLDLAPLGRNETDGTMSWVRLHDEYPEAKAASSCPACAA